MGPQKVPGDGEVEKTETLHEEVSQSGDFSKQFRFESKSDSQGPRGTHTPRPLPHAGKIPPPSTPGSPVSSTSRSTRVSDPENFGRGPGGTPSSIDREGRGESSVHRAGGPDGRGGEDELVTVG